MQLGFGRREVWTLQPSSFPSRQATSCMKLPISFSKPKNSVSKRRQHHHAVQNPYTGPLLPIEYLGQQRLEIYTSPLPPAPAPNLGKENSTFWLLRSFILDLGGWGRGWVCLLFHFILSKIVVKIALGWAVRGKICIGLNNRIIKISYFDFRLYWRFSILNT